MTEKRAYAVVCGLEDLTNVALAAGFQPGDEVEIRLRVAQGEEQDDSPLLVNEMMGLLADSMEHTMELAMQHGYDLDDVKSFRLLTRVNEMKERLEKNRKRLLGEDCTCSGRARHFPTGIVHIDSCPRSVVGLLRARAAALAAAPEEQEAPRAVPFDAARLSDEDIANMLIWVEGDSETGRSLHAEKKRRATPAALPEEVVCRYEGALSGHTGPHQETSYCSHPRPAHLPAARTEQEKQLGEEGLITDALLVLAMIKAGAPRAQFEPMLERAIEKAATDEIAPGCGTYPQWANRVDTLKRGRDAAMARAQRATEERDAAREKLKEEEGANILNRAALKNALRWRNQIAKALRDLLTAYQGTGEYQADIADNAARVLAQPFTADQPAPVSAAPVEPAPPSPETTFKRQPNGMLTATPPDNAAAFAAPHARSATPEPAPNVVPCPDCTKGQCNYHRLYPVDEPVTCEDCLDPDGDPHERQMFGCKPPPAPSATLEPEKLGEEKTVLRCRVCGGIWSELSLGGWIAVNDRAETCSHLISSFERIPDMRAAPTTKVGED